MITSSRLRFSPLLRRILLVNLVPLAMLLAALLYLDQYQNGLLAAEVSNLREEARIYAGALGESAVRQITPDMPTLAQDIARPLLRRLAEPTPNAEARLFSVDPQSGTDAVLVADSRDIDGPGGAVRTEPLPPPAVKGASATIVSMIYDLLLSKLPRHVSQPNVLMTEGPGFEWRPDMKAQIAGGTMRTIPPFIRRDSDKRLLVTVTEPVLHDRHLIGFIQLTQDAREVDESLFAIRVSVLSLFTLALGLTFILSAYLSRTIARPILSLAHAARAIGEGKGRSTTIPDQLLTRGDEVGELAASLRGSAEALWTRMDAIERFAADVAHEIKNPLSSIRSAIETLLRIEDPTQQRRLMAIIADDVIRLDRLISDISDASRVDAEISRVSPEKIDISAMLETLAEIDAATRAANAPCLALELPADQRLVAMAVEDRLVQVLRNLIGNAQSFSPAGGKIILRGFDAGPMIGIAVEDQGPGIPQAKLQQIFDRFYSERPREEQFGKHSGLGLSISYQIINALRGDIHAENRRDDDGKIIGARFVVRLPKAAV